MTDLFGVHWNPRGPPKTLREAMQGNRIVDDGLIDETAAALRKGEISSHLVRALVRRIGELESTNKTLASDIKALREERGSSGPAKRMHHRRKPQKSLTGARGTDDSSADL